MTEQEDKNTQWKFVAGAVIAGGIIYYIVSSYNAKITKAITIQPLAPPMPIVASAPPFPSNL